MKEIYKAIFNLQQECPVITKATKTKNYMYADLPAIYEVVLPIMKKYKLGFTHLFTEDDHLKTVIFLVDSDEQIESTVRMPFDVKLDFMNMYQSMGSGITYFRRYALCCALGIIADEDTDGGSKADYSTSKQLNTSATSEDTRPWLTPVQYEAMKTAIVSGKGVETKEAMKKYKMKNEYKDTLNGLLKAHNIN